MLRARTYFRVEIAWAGLGRDRRGDNGHVTDKDMVTPRSLDDSEILYCVSAYRAMLSVAYVYT